MPRKGWVKGQWGRTTANWSSKHISPGVYSYTHTHAHTLARTQILFYPLSLCSAISTILHTITFTKSLSDLYMAHQCLRSSPLPSIRGAVRKQHNNSFNQQIKVLPATKMQLHILVSDNKTVHKKYKH